MRKRNKQSKHLTCKPVKTHGHSFSKVCFSTLTWMRISGVFCERKRFQKRLKNVCVRKILHLSRNKGQRAPLPPPKKFNKQQFTSSVADFLVICLDKTSAVRRKRLNVVALDTASNVLLNWYYDQKITFIFSSDFETMVI